MAEPKLRRRGHGEDAILERAIRHAQANDLVARNVAALVKPPRGRAGRPSKSFTLDQAKALLAAAEGTRTCTRMWR
jgi:hypothetical protein